MKKVKEIRIYTPSNSYVINDAGQVLQYSGNGLNKHGQTFEQLNIWVIKGLREIKAFNNLGDLIPINRLHEIKNFCFKNGKPKYAICDLDHGTYRVRGNYKYHGCCGIGLS
jgi:hypothetical protein